MDFHLKPWRDQQQHQMESEATEPNQQQEEEQSSVSSADAASKPKLFLESPYSQPSSSSTAAAAAAGSGITTLPLFVPGGGGGGGVQQQQQQQVKEEKDSAHPFTKFTNLSSAFPSSEHHSAPCRFPRNTNNRSYICNNIGSYFSLAQWQELELQALIYRYILVGAAVPPELLQPIYFLHSSFSSPHYPPAAACYWGRTAMDPEPGRCRRTDGKKWRCSRGVVAGQKYCERHVHRGRNRSRKPVEIPSLADSATASPITAASAAPISAVVAGGGSSRLSPSRSSPTSSIDMFCQNQR